MVRTEGKSRVIVDRTQRAIKTGHIDANVLMLQRSGKPKFRSGFERVVNSALEAEDVYAKYSSSAFLMDGKNPVGKSHRRRDLKTYGREVVKYTSDFITNIKIGNRIVMFEPHGEIVTTQNSLYKYMRFMEEFGDRYYLVLITDMSKEKLAELADQWGINKAIASEIWYIKDAYLKDIAENSTKGRSVFLAEKIEELKLRSKILSKTRDGTNC